MKKILTSIAMALLLVGCAKQYDDSAIQTRIADLERRVTSLESSVDALRSAIGEGVYVVKVQEYADTETGKVIGVTVTYSNGEVKYFEITPKVDYAGPVVSIIKNGAGDLVWAVDGVAIKDGNGKDVTVYQTPVFTIDGDGNLLVSIDGSDPVVLGQVQNEGATLVDGIFTDIKVMEDKIVLTLSDNSVVNIPYIPFKLKIENNDIVFEKKGDVIEIPYTITGATAGAVVKVTGYNPNDFTVEVKEDKILVTPTSSTSAAVMLVSALCEAGFYSAESIVINHEVATVTNPNIDDYIFDYIVDSDGGSLEVKVASNIDIEVVLDGSFPWITVVDTKAMTTHTITLSIEANTDTQDRYGVIGIAKKGTTRVVSTVYIYQNGFVPGPKDLSKAASANSYIVTAAGDYKFKTVKGNSSESVGTVASADLLWETVNTATAPDVNSIIASVSYADDYITFSTPATLKAGNALIAAKDANGVILWSWHIWIPATEITTNTHGIYNAVMMDRNLGALVAAASGEEAPVESYGLFYQWGRKDPFPGPGATSGSGFAKTTGSAPSQLSGDGATDACKITLEQSIQNPLLMGRANNGDWITPSDNTLWVDESKTIYDPCPPGYRVPARISSEPLHGSDYTAVTGWFESKDYHIFGMGDPVAVFPFTGYLDDYDPASGVAKNGLRALYWTAHKSDDKAAYGMNVRETTSGGNAHKLSTAGKSRGSSVRCVADTVSE
jgi:hypothetical protein